MYPSYSTLAMGNVNDCILHTIDIFIAEFKSYGWCKQVLDLCLLSVCFFVSSVVFCFFLCCFFCCFLCCFFCCFLCCFLCCFFCFLLCCFFCCFFCCLLCYEFNVFTRTFLWVQFFLAKWTWTVLEFESRVRIRRPIRITVNIGIYPKRPDVKRIFLALF